MPKIILIGLDGFDPDLARRWMAEGVLPHLATLADRGDFTPLKSTIPPFTYPAWSSLLTGVNPGRHGIIDFAVRRPGRYSVEYVNSTHRLEPTIFHHLSRAGKRVAAMGFPTTYPPEPVNGVMISGFDSPLAYTADRSFCYPSSLWDELKTRVSAYTLAGIPELDTGEGWRQKACNVIRDTIRRRTDIAEYLLQKEPWDLFAVVFSESDTTAHHFWAAHDPLSPRHRPGDAVFTGFLKEVYQSLDESVGKLMRHAGPDTLILVVSDHGSGGTGTHLLSLNRILEQAGFFRYRRAGETSGMPRSVIHRLAGAVPARLGEWLFRKGPRAMLQHIESRNRLANANIGQCIAFSDELNYFPSVWLNDQRFPHGRHYDAVERRDILQKVSSCLKTHTDAATGRPVIRDVFAKENLFYGPALEWIPDLVVVPAMDGDYSLTVWNAPCPGPALTDLPEREIRGRKGGSMNGSHRPYGVLFSSESTMFVKDAPPRLEDIGATILAHSGLDIAKLTLDGRSLFGTPDNPMHPAKRHASQPSPEAAVDPIPYTETESREIEERLKRLGYL